MNLALFCDGGLQRFVGFLPRGGFRSEGGLLGFAGDLALDGGGEHVAGNFALESFRAVGVHAFFERRAVVADGK